MNDNFNSQKEKLMSLRQEISLLRRQIDFLLRNEKAVGTLDLDVLLNRTRSIYEQLCTIGIEDEEAEEPDLSDQVEELEPSQTEPNNATAVAVQNGEEEKEHDIDVENTSLSENIPDTVPEEVTATEVPEAISYEDKRSADDAMEKEEASVLSAMEAVEEQETESDSQPADSDLGFLFKLADEPGAAEVTDNKVIHYIEQIPESEITEQDLKDMEPRHENLFEMPPMETEEEPGMSMSREDPETDKEEREVAELLYGADTLYDLEQQERQLSLESELTSAAHGQDGAADPTSNIGVPQTEGLLFDVPSRPIGEEKPVVAEDREELPTPLIIKPSAENQPEETEVAFELEEPTVLGDRMRQDDHSLAAKLNKKPLDSLKTAIGINDKFLFVNELFGGSMEKFNKSIDNLNDLKTLNGALIYLNELKIELQWNSSNEAYRKLSDLVSRKFE